jgi:hypothetical protein
VRSQLGAERLAYLATLPFSYSVRPEAGHELLIVHANPRDVEQPMRRDTPEESLRQLLSGVTAEVVAFGHIHTPYIRTVDGITLFDIASVGLPRDGDVRSAYGIAEWKEGAWRLEHVRVPYDFEAVFADIRKRNMPAQEQVIQKLRAVQS